MTSGLADELSFVARPLSSSFRRVTQVIAAGDERVFEDDRTWRGAIVVIAAGEVELCLDDGSRGRFTTGSVLWFDGLPLRALRNPGDAPATVVAVARATARPWTRDQRLK